MTVVVITAVPAALRGLLSRWFIEVATGVYVGRVSERVHAEIASIIQSRMERGGRAVVCRATLGEQGWAAVSFGDPDLVLREVDGLVLATRASRAAVKPA